MKNPPVRGQGEAVSDTVTKPETDKVGIRPLASRELILSHLENGKPITALEALKKYNCLSLAQRIYELKQRGHKICSRMIELKNGKRVAQYRLITARPCSPECRCIILKERV